MAVAATIPGALSRLAFDDDRPFVARPEDALFGVETQARLAPRRIGTVAVEAIVRKDGPNIAIEFNLVARANRRGCNEEDNDCESVHDCLRGEVDYHPPGWKKRGFFSLPYTHTTQRIADLECGGLTPLSFFLQCHKVPKKESGVEPPHSKGTSRWRETDRLHHAERVLGPVADDQLRFQPVKVDQERPKHHDQPAHGERGRPRRTQSETARGQLAPRRSRQRESLLFWASLRERTSFATGDSRATILAH